MTPLLPIDHQTMPPRTAADLLRGFAELVESYPATQLIVSIDLQLAPSETPPKPRSRASAPKAKPTS